MFHPRKKSGRKNALPLIHHSLMRDAFFRQLELWRILEHHLMMRAAGGDHRVTILVGIGMNIHQDWTLVPQAFLQHGFYFAWFERAQAGDTIGIRQLHVIRQLPQNARRVPALVEQILPLAHHAVNAIIEHDDFHWQFSFGGND
jgi:hypothetical protein